jgi:hypothetical protein
MHDVVGWTVICRAHIPRKAERHAMIRGISLIMIKFIFQHEKGCSVSNNVHLQMTNK